MSPFSFWITGTAGSSSCLHRNLHSLFKNYQPVGGLAVGGLAVGGLAVGGLAVGGLAVGGLAVGGLRAACGRVSRQSAFGGLLLAVCFWRFEFGGLSLVFCVWRLALGDLRGVCGRFAGGLRGVCGRFAGGLLADLRVVCGL